jgi:hypothetical protein
VARFSAEGQNALFAPPAINSLTCLVELPDGSITLLTFEEFRKAAGW